jgi:asparagine synthetase B (glutamine-hydrolysing)
MFSGGLDSTLIAHISSICVPEGNSIDLLSLSFNGENSSDRKSSIESYYEL